ncbi:hypothetical protein BS47DRAFT_1368748 [Hydnum rufescens UP504]|uniref:Uncharacterized protein n=1 Tax=Hydnum rufescens UP504 TaxID=1448309 RepID=A0A9P6DMP9_9AGAM|nr:hypothetical protein BS47DRAFT_1368748 [Hydnum rufescens UP504]
MHHACCKVIPQLVHHEQGGEIWVLNHLLTLSYYQGCSAATNNHHPQHLTKPPVMNQRCCTFQSFIEGLRVLPGIDLQLLSSLHTMSMNRGHGTSAWNMGLLPASSDKELVLERPSKSQAPSESSAGDSSCLLVMSNLPHPQPRTLWEMCQQGDVEYLNLCVYYLTWWFKSLGVRVDSVFATAFFDAEEYVQ